MTKTKDQTIAVGSVHGRGPHPNCPELGSTHWPLAALHEKADYTGKTAGFVQAPRPAPALTPQPDGSKPAGARETPVKQPSSSTGLVTRADFLQEADRLKVGTSTMTEKIIAWFAREDVGEGMKRMQCNMLLRNAAKKKAKEGL